MELELISGRFPAKDAEQILTDIFQVKIDYHQRKIHMQYLSEENIQHAEKRIVALQDTLRSILKRIRESGKEMVDIHAHVELSLAAPLTQ
ncbi:MAG: hypothetical protein IM584_05540 [Chitinophagaceae bacterium]|nr:hypothetical protein [Chitinophagaceae bacterium]MEA3424881.1 hypothetical protein [Bacteroidota bacterium]MCA6454469.1 hypothetical protein [Chitinophagaceae bacterium]MCA6455581.1 hypothetical protein [Chitinophagaceae bacterium]MCA6458420.1 hypothetical protein [Chitinophagaceae bacterium]